MKLKLDQEKLEAWIKSSFKDYKCYKSDYLVNSPFKEDNKFKLSISIEKQCYHCWKSDESGPIWKLICFIDKCSKKEALDKIYSSLSLDNFENEIESLKKQAQIQINSQKKSESLNYPEYFSFVSKDLDNKMNVKSLLYCAKRKINPFKWKLGYCDKGKLFGRLIIPYYKDNKLIYWNARSLINQEPKYLNPQIEENTLSKEDILFSKKWNFKNNDVFIVEGAIDAISLMELGFNAVAIQGKSISRYQLEYLRNCSRIILAFDNDLSGLDALIQNQRFLNENGLYSILYILPPAGLKDWNEWYIKDMNFTKSYINKNIKNLSFYEIIKIKMENNI